MWSGLPFCSHRYRLRHNKFAESFFCGKFKVPIFSLEDLDNYRPQLDECPSTHVLCSSWQYFFILYIKEKINVYRLSKKFILFYSWSKIPRRQECTKETILIVSWRMLSYNQSFTILFEYLDNKMKLWISYLIFWPTSILKSYN